MKILFVFKSENFLVPIGPSFISAMAKKEGHEVFLSETHISNPMHEIEKINPDIVAYSSSTGESKHYIRIDKEIKDKFPNVFSIIGGPHPTFYPELVKETTIDAACIGEGEFAMIDVLREMSNGHHIEGIKNIFTKNSKDFSVRNLVQDLDSLPFPDYDLFYANTEMGKYPLKGFLTSRGCPYSCTYCFNSAWRKIYKDTNGRINNRKHSVDYVIADIKRVRSRWPLSCVKFQDDVFSFRVDDWLMEFCNKYKKEINLPFFILNRCDLVNEEMIRLLRGAGCQTISMSIEAGNPDSRLHNLGRRMTDEQIVKAHHLCEKYDIATFTNCIAGIPDTTIKEDIESLDLSLKSRVTWGEFPIFYPFPKTELGDMTIAKGYYKPDYNSMHTSYQNTSVLSCFTEEEKNIQMNFGMLASVAIAFPMLRNIIVNFLIYLPPNKMFTFVYWLSKNYILRKRIYNTKTTWIQSVRIFLRSLHQEVFRHAFHEK